MLTEKDKKILAKMGWTLECELPFEIRHEDGSFATGQAAMIMMLHLREMEPPLCVECGAVATNTQRSHCQEHEHLVL